MLRKLRELGRRAHWGQRPSAQHAVPPALIAPTGSESRQESIQEWGAHAQGDGVAVGTMVAFRQQEEKHDRSRNAAEHEKASEDEQEDHRIRHTAPRHTSSGRTFQAALPPQRRVGRATPKPARPSRPLQSLLDDRPELDEGYLVLDALDADLLPFGDRTSVDRTRANGPVRPGIRDRDLPLPVRGDGGRD